MIVMGHRGAKGEAPENTLEGFQYAKRVGVEHIELDVRMSADNQLVVIHDETVDRTTNSIGKVTNFSADQLSELNASADFPDWPRRCGVPTLPGVIKSFPDFQSYQIEIKSDTSEALEQVCKQVSDVLRQFSIEDRTILSSFDPDVLKVMRYVEPKQSLCYIWPIGKSSLLNETLELGCTAFSLEVSNASKEMVDQAHKFGLFVYGWTANSFEQASKLIDCGVDAIETDYPSTIIPFTKMSVR